MSPQRPGLIATAFLVSAGLLAAATPASADDLFSRNGFGSIFDSPPSQNQTPTPPQRTPGPGPAPAVRRIEPAPKLGGFLQAAGYEIEDLGNNVYGMKVESGKWTYPMLVFIDGNTDRLWIAAIVTTVKNQASIPTDRLLGMLHVNNDISPSFFAISEKTGRIDVNRCLPNRDLLPQQVRNEIEGLAAVATKTDYLWDQTQWTSNPNPVTNAPQRQPQQPAPPRNVSPSTPYWQTPNTQSQAPAPRSVTPTPPVQTTGNIVGKWLCSVSNEEAFGLVFNADGSYRLIHVKGDQTNTVDGRFTLTGSAVRFVSNANETMEGTITWNSGDEFRFRTSGDTGPNSGLVFARMAA